MIRKFLSYSWLLIFFIAFKSMGQEAVLQGVVRQQATKEPLEGAVVRIIELNENTLTNALGEFKIKGIVPKEYTLSISHIGFSPAKQTVQVSGGKTTAIQVVLQEAPLLLNQVEVASGSTHTQQLISKLDIAMRPIQNSQEVLRSVPGLFIGQHAGGGKAEQIFLRGFDIDHGTDIRLSADGVPVNMVSHAHGQGYADLHYLIPELIEHVAFKKGPYYADKGNFTTAGWVDFRTKRVLDKSFVKLEVGQFDTYRGVAGVQLLRTPNHNLYVASEYNYSNSFFDAPQRFHRFNGQLGYQGTLGANTQLTVTANTFGSRWNHSGQIPDRAVASGQIGFFGSIDPTEGGLVGRSQLNAIAYTNLPGGHLLKNQVFGVLNNFDLYSNFTFFLNDPLNGDQIKQTEKRRLWGYQGSYSAKFFKNVETTIGLDYRYDQTDGTLLARTANRTTILEKLQFGDINEWNTALYIDNSIPLSTKWLLNAGLRWDTFQFRYLDKLTDTHASSSTSLLQPKFSVYYTPTKDWQLYLTTGRGFHSNDTRVVVQQPARRSLPPAYGADLGGNFKVNGRLLLSAAAWYLWLDQEFVYVGDEGVVEPSGRTARQGLDVSARYQITPKLFIDADLNYTKPRAIDEQLGMQYIPLAPILTSVGGLSWQQVGPWSGSARFRYMGNRPANEDNSIVAKGYFVNDLQLNYTKKAYQLGLSVNNLFNVRWKETQFATESRLKTEAAPVEEIHFTPGSPFFARLSIQYSF